MAITGIITDTKGNKIYPVTKASSVYTSTGMTVEEALTFRQTPQHATYADGVFTIQNSGLTSTPKQGETLVLFFDSASSVASNGSLKINNGPTYPMYWAGATRGTVLPDTPFYNDAATALPNRPYMFIFASNSAGEPAWICIYPTNVVHTNDLAADAVTTAKITNNAITTAKLAPSAVTTGIIADGAVTNTKIGSKAVKSDNIDWATLWRNGVAGGYINTQTSPEEDFGKLTGAYARSFFTGDNDFFIQPQTFHKADKAVCMILICPNNQNASLGLVLYRVNLNKNGQAYVATFNKWLADDTPVRLQGRGIVISPGAWSTFTIFCPSNLTFSVEGGQFQ